ncbi:MAG: hypothetical protein J1E03_08805 [Acetatifactor sp.]|nr:hypothetical protein [Acetatifactor sp.]
MEYLIMFLALAGILLAMFLIEAVRAKKQEKKYIKELYQDCQKLREKKYASERYEHMGSYFRRHPEDGQIDDITWNDLGMDDIFKQMNYTLSASGEEYLYYTLRSLRQEDHTLEHLEEVVQYFGSHPDVRVKVQLQMRKLGYTGKFSLYDYLDNLDYLGERSNRGSLIRDFLFLIFIAILFFNITIGILGIVTLAISNIMIYFKQKDEIDPYITSFAYVLRLLDVCGCLEKQDIPVCLQEWEELKQHRHALQAMRRNSFWVMSPGRGSNNASGNPIEMLLDYVRMVFHVDLIKFNHMLKHLRGHISDVDALNGITGFLETAISVWAFRQSLEEGYCLPEFVEEMGLEMMEGYHPLLEHPVKNSISANRGVLLTGSNASGKSTFLKTAALNAILAQTIHTCTAESYRAPLFHVYSSMALRDDMESGESYYIVEIKALKRILDGAVDGKRPVLCFVDEVLRGTNTVERIAASTQILASLGTSGILCFAATHDIELTELLEDQFDNYHFEEDVLEGDIVFNYRLLKGKATTRNAIRLLELMGYEDRIIKLANAQAEHFLETGEWERRLT